MTTTSQAMNHGIGVATLQSSEHQKLYYIILRDGGHDQYELMEYNENNIVGAITTF